MANIKKIKLNAFKFQPFSKKQMQLLTWWQEDSPVSDRFICVADGSIRSGKSVCMITSFVLYVMTHFEQQNSAICGKSIGTLKRNVVNPLKQICETIGYEVIEHRSENFLEIRDGDKVNFVYLFGGKDESSQDLVVCAVYG